MGFFGNATLSWRDQAYLNVTGREDVVSTMPRGHRAFFYPSVSVAYVLTELEPLQGNPVLTFAKVRGSFAQVGQAGRYYNNYYVTPSYTGGFWSNPPILYPLNGITAYVPYAELYDPDLTPQNTNSFEAGIRPAALPQPACRQLHLLAAEHQEPDIPRAAGRFDRRRPIRDQRR